MDMNNTHSMAKFICMKGVNNIILHRWHRSAHLRDLAKCLAYDGRVFVEIP